MCGIGGYWGAPPAGDGEGTLEALGAALRHRGPDQGGRFLDENVGLAIRRLRIIDLSTGDQPIAGEDGRVVTVFNGEIYNHADLRRDLEQRGHTFRTRADTEVIVHLFEDEGEEFLHRLRGMFALAVYDRRARRLLVARDRLGIKPLYYAETPGGLMFASEIPALLAAGAPDQVDADALGAYFRLGYVPSPATCYRGIRSLPPGWRMVLEPGGHRMERWWSLGTAPRRPLPRTPGEAREEVRRLVEESVRLRLLSDVPLGAFLSGGLDSTLVVGTMARLMDRPVDTFTIGFDEPGFDETVHSREAAARFATRRHEQVIGADALDVMDDLVGAFGQPFADPSAVPTLLVSRLARRHVTVALSGDGGDELFGGYTRYALARSQQWYDAVPRPLRAAAAAAWPAGLRGAGLLRIASRPFGERYLENNALTTPSEREALLAPDLAQAAAANPYRLAEPLVREMQAGLRSVEDLLRLDLHSYLSDVILAKVDLMSMQCSLEARVPLLDHVLVETVSALPLAWRMGPRGSKQLLREAFADLYPPAIRTRGKMGFGVPLGAWLSGPLAGRLADLPSAEAVRHGPLRAEGVRRLVEEHRTGARDRGRKLWSIMVFTAWWARRGSRRPAAAPAGGLA